MLLSEIMNGGGNYTKKTVGILGQNAQKCPEGNTDNLWAEDGKRYRWFPSFTSFLENEPHYDESKMKYLCYGAEVCPTSGRKHWQGCVYFYDKKSISSAQKLLKIGKSHIEFIQKSDDSADSTNYCKKDENYKEFGQMPVQGKRTDLEALIRDIKEGTLTTNEIVLSNPVMYHQYGRTLEKAEDLVKRKKFRTEMTTCDWYYGETGVGKSHTAFRDYAPETHYVLPLNDKGWWDGYNGQQTVVVNEFRGEIEYRELLDLIDKWPKQVPRRGREPQPFISTHIIITSSLPPDEIYKKRNSQDSLAQLLRRIKVIHLNSIYIST